MDFKKKDEISIILIPHRSGKHTKHFKIARWKLRVLIVLGVLFFLLLPVTVMVYEFRFYNLNNNLAKTEDNLATQTEKNQVYTDAIKKLDQLAYRYTHIQPVSIGGEEPSESPDPGDSNIISFVPPYVKMTDILSEDHIDKIISHYTELQKIMDSTPSIWPVKQGADQIITSTFGWRRSQVTGKRVFHEGIDITCPEGTPILATSDGVVMFSGLNGRYGNSIVIQHDFQFSTVYAHNRVNFVKREEEVKRGQIIGEVGNTGNSTGPHLHYEVRINGRQVNPWKYMF